MDVAESTGDYEGSADLYGQELVTSSRRLEGDMQQMILYLVI